MTSNNGNTFVGYQKSLKENLFDIKFSQSFNPKQIKTVQPGYLSSVYQQRKYAECRFKQLQQKLANKSTDILEEEVWAWGIFSQTVLPMLSFLDE
jgi:hypothetical protein